VLYVSRYCAGTVDIADSTDKGYFETMSTYYALIFAKTTRVMGINVETGYIRDYSDSVKRNVIAIRDKILKGEEFALNNQDKLYPIYSECTSKDIVLPEWAECLNRLSFVNNAAFYYPRVEKLTIHGGIRKIIREDFKCVDHMRIVVIEEGVTEIGEYAFEDWKNLEVIVIPKSVKAIGKRAFALCNRLKHADISGVDIIEEEVFFSCFKLTSVELSPTVTEIRTSAFRGCEMLKGLKCLHGVGNWSSLVKIGETALMNTYLQNVVIPENVVEIGACCFGDCTELHTIVFESKTMKSIPRFCFVNCKRLVRVTLPSSIENIGESAFSSCESLHEINIPEGVSFFGKSCFFDTRITELNLIAENVLIEEEAFDSCGELINVNIRSIMHLETGAFTDCTELVSFIAEGTIDKIKRKTFENCISLKTVTLPKSVKSVESDAFSGCNCLPFNDRVTFIARRLKLW